MKKYIQFNSYTSNSTRDLIREDLHTIMKKYKQLDLHLDLQLDNPLYSQLYSQLYWQLGPIIRIIKEEIYEEI